MELICPEIERLVACRSCGSQALPPYRLCWNSHVGCPPCVEYLPHCACGVTYYDGRNPTFDCLVSALKFKCKYRPSSTERGGREGSTEAAATGDGPPQGECDASQWYDLTELREHYRAGCSMNAFRCPLDGCGGHRGRVDTIIDHYEDAHGPFERLTPGDPSRPQFVTFHVLPSDTKVVRKIFNGYFLLNVMSPRRWLKNPSTMAMQNINPADRLRYKYETKMQSHLQNIVVCVSLLNRLENPI